MHIFSRTRVMHTGRVQETQALAVEMAQRAKVMTGVETTVSIGRLGYQPRTLIWTSRIDAIEEYDTFADVQAELEASCGLDNGDRFAAPCTEELTEVVAATNVAAPTDFSALITATRASIGSGRVLEWGVETSEYIGSLTGCAVIFGHVPFGELGELRWWIGFDAVAEIDRTFALIGADDEFARRLELADPLLTGRSSCRVSKRVDGLQGL